MKLKQKRVINEVNCISLFLKFTKNQISWLASIQIYDGANWTRAFQTFIYGGI